MEPIEANYLPDGDDWAITVTRAGKTLSGTAPGLIAARDRADQLVEKLAPADEKHHTVVHMIDGNALEFTSAYLTARLSLPEVVVPKPAESAEQEPVAVAKASAASDTPADEVTPPAART